MNFHQLVTGFLSLVLSNPFVELLEIILVFAAAILSYKNLSGIKRLEVSASYQEELLKIHYQEKLSCIKDFLASAGKFISSPSNDSLYYDMVSKSGLAVYVSSHKSMMAIESFLKYAQLLKSGADNLINPEHEYFILSVTLGQESVQMSTIPSAETGSSKIMQLLKNHLSIKRVKKTQQCKRCQ